MSSSQVDSVYIEQLLSSIEASPTPYHCVAESARRLADAGFA